MSRLPFRPQGNKPNNDADASSQPVLSGGREVFVSDSVSPQLASDPADGAAPTLPRTLPTPPVIPDTAGLRQRAPQAPQQRSERPVPAPEVPVQELPERLSERPVEAPQAAERSVTLQPIAPSIENLSHVKNEAHQDLAEVQKRRAAAIANLPADLKQSINKLFEHLADDTISEVVLDGPKEIGFKKSGHRFVDPHIDFYDTETYHAVINDFLLPMTNRYDRIGSTPHLVEGQLTLPDPENPSRPPMIARVHIVAPPAVPNAIITIAKKARNQLTIDSMVQSGTMTTDMAKFLKDLARGRATIVFSGLSGSGKTTLLEAMSREFDPSDRIILIEDVEELSFAAASVVQLLSHQPLPGEDPNNAVTLEWLVRQANRMRADRIIVGEVRGAEMAEFLTAANSGADGSMTTVHANSPQEAINKMMSLSMKSASVKSEQSLLRDVASTVQIIVQLSNIDGRHVVSQIEEVSNTINRNTLGIQTSTIYKYDRNTQRFTFENRVSDEFQMFLKQRGVEVSNPSTMMHRY